MKKEAWQAHIDACNNSKQTVTDYASQHGLVYSQMLYWSRKLSDPPKKRDKPEPTFVAVKVEKPKPIVSVLGVLEFPNGIKLHIHSVELLNGIPDLWAGRL